MLISELVSTANAVAATRSRRAKVAALAVLFRQLRVNPDEISSAVGMLLGKPRQGRIGVGWRGLTTALKKIEFSPDTPALSVHDVDAILGELASITGNGSVAARSTVLNSLFSRAGGADREFLVRMMLGDVRIGALEGVLVEAIAEAAERPTDVVRQAAMLTGDLGETARIALTAPESALYGVRLLLGRPVQPMLAASAITAAEAVTTTGEASVEYKLDGARIQVHRDGDKIQVFTRNLADITARVPDVVGVVRSLPVKSVILDGETLTLNESGVPRPFQETLARFGSDNSDGTDSRGDLSLVLHPWFFDVLHVDGRDLIDEPLSVRRAELIRIAGDHVIPGEITADPAAAERVLTAALAAGHEGVVVKAISATYSAGRRGASWIKVKPVHTFDLVVLAAEWGYGRRTGWLSNLHLGAYDPVGEFGEVGGFVMVGKTFKGLTDELLNWQTSRFQEIETHRTGAEAGDTGFGTVWVQPKIVVEIAIDGVQRSSRYPGGLALRFARVKRYREDKNPETADTVQALRVMLRGKG